MENLIRLLNEELRKITSESFHAVNRKQEVIYPYLTYDFDAVSLEDDIDGFYLDLDIFDNNPNYMNIIRLEDKLKQQLKGIKKLTDELHVRFYYQGSNKIATLDDQIKRRQSVYRLRVFYK